MRLGSSAVTMVGHCRFLLTEEKKANFQQYVEEREAWWCGDPREAASWWTPPGGLGEPRRVGEIATMDNAWLVGHYARDFLWEAQVCTCGPAETQGSSAV